MELAPPSELAAARGLLTPEAVRERCGNVLAAARAGGLDHFALDEARLDAAADYVIAVMREAYPDLAIPPHARWRHFGAGGIDRWQSVRAQFGNDIRGRARAAFDLVITSVLLDAGAGGRWRYRGDESGRDFARSEGLAVASLRLFQTGGFSADAQQPLRADGPALAALSPQALTRAFKVSPENPLEGLEGRAGLIRRLGETVCARADLFGEEMRPGGLFDHLEARAGGGALPAREILVVLLEALGPIWPGRIRLGGIDLGDTWRHGAAGGEGPTAGLVPFHKLSQWLAYSLIEPLAEAGVAVTGRDALTGLAEYRNGGLFVDLGVLVPRHEAVTGTVHAPGAEAVVEWRALTVALVDVLAERIRARLDLDAAALPLASVLEGGTWAAGRRIAAERRADGSPPIAVRSDGSVF